MIWNPPVSKVGFAGARLNSLFSLVPVRSFSHVFLVDALMFLFSWRVDVSLKENQNKSDALVGDLGSLGGGP